MKLEKVILSGFKSFADKTEFEFAANITAIVGPNGCGKSNVVDAVKWVLGEQSAKSLRSGQMLDVIFSGSGSRKPINMAEVSLCFSGYSNGENADDRLHITRRLYRNGDSEYLINEKACRLKDIKESLMDTGMGVRAYSIIEQGQVDQLINVSKVDRRAIFEEASGISKYKAHKKEALRKLERTEQNLLRLADIVGEVQKQLRSIKLQAGKARNYLQYSQRLKELRVNFSLSEFHQFTCNRAERTIEQNAFQDQFGSIVAQVAGADARMSELSNTVMQTENDINRADNALVSVKSKIEQHFQRIEFLKTKIDDLAKRKASASEQIAKFNEQNAKLNEELTASQQQLTESEGILAAKDLELGTLNKELHEINMQAASVEADLQDEKSGIIDIVRRTAQLHNEIQSIGIYRNNLSGQKDRLSTRANAAKEQLEKLLFEKAGQQARFEEISQVLSQLQVNLDSKRADIEKIGSELAKDNKELMSAKEKKSAIVSERNVLADMERRQEGLNKAVKQILLQKGQGKFSYIEGMLADAIIAEPQYAMAVEAALEGKADSLVVSSTSEFLADAESISKLDGRVSLIFADRIRPLVNDALPFEYDGVLGVAAQFVKNTNGFAPMIWQLLGKVVVVSTLEAGIELSGKAPADYKFVTLKGELISGACLNAGPMGKATGLISRKSRLRELDAQLAAISVSITDIENKLDENEQQNDHLNKLCKDLRTSVYEANTEKVEVNSKLGLIEQNVKRLIEEQPSIEGEISLIEEQIAQSIRKEGDSKGKLAELEEINTQRSARIAELERQFASHKAIQQQKQAQLTDLKVALGQIGEQVKAARQKIGSVNSQLHQAKLAVESSRSEMSSCSEQIDQTERNILAAESALSELYMEKDQAQRTSVELHQKVELLREEYKVAESQLRAFRASQQEIESKLNEVKMALGQIQVKMDDLAQRVQEELLIDLAHAYQNYQQENMDWEVVKQEIADLRSKIERLGNVNVDAIQEQEELEKRDQFLVEQVTDLNNSKSQLEQLIAKINKESREKFRATFEQIRLNFQELFRKLFGGGKADIILEDPEDILECGIEIMAKPPGKETRSISLLSGGEKTMTAISLLFSIFKSKPSPFCFLDEVDAALDEANNERFNLIVREFQQMSQFVVITHSKRTMSIADVLFGVTMQQQGVSKKISVKFEQLDSETAA